MPSMIVSRTREAAGCRVSASSSCGGNVSIHVDIIRVEGYQVICLVRTYQVRAHNAVHGAVKEIAGAAHHIRKTARAFSRSFGT